MLGWGVYEGDHVPETGPLALVGVRNPRIRLDSGKVVWGYECWWGPEAGFKTKLEEWRNAGYTIEDVDIDDARRGVEPSRDIAVDTIA